MLTDSDGHDRDLSDGEFERVKQRFVALLPKHGTLWKSLASQKPLHNRNDGGSIAIDYLNGLCPMKESFANQSLLGEDAVSDGAKLPPVQSISVIHCDDEADDSSERTISSRRGSSSRLFATNACMSEEDKENGLPDNDDSSESGSSSDLSFFDVGRDQRSSHRFQQRPVDYSTISSSSNRKHSFVSSVGESDNEDSCSGSGESTKMAWDEWKSPEECVNETLPICKPTQQDAPTRHLQSVKEDQNQRKMVLRSIEPQSPVARIAIDSAIIVGCSDARTVIDLDNSSVQSIAASGVIDLVSSSDEENQADSGHAKASRGSPTTNLISRKEQSFHTSEEEFQWDNESLRSDSSEGCQPREEKQIRSLTDRTNRLTINENPDSDESSVGAFHKRRMRTKVDKKKVSSFKRQRHDLSQSLFSQFDKAVCDGRLAPCTRVEWNNKLRTTAGLTRMMSLRGGTEHDRKVVIELSIKVLDDEDRLRNTLLHEICHAAAFVVDGTTKPPHGNCFQKWARRAMERVPGATVTTTHDYEIQFKYSWSCTSPNCHFIVQRHSRSVHVEKHTCPMCNSRLMASGMSSNAKVNTASKRQKAPSEYNRFIQDNFGKVRKSLLNNGTGAVTQAEVMKECSRLWREANQEYKPSVADKNVLE